MRLPLRRAALLSLFLATPAAAGSPPIPDDVDRRVESILATMTLEEKIDYVGGVDGFYVRDIPKAGVPRLKMADGPLGVRNFGPATAYAAGIGLAASWNPVLAERVGTELGRDARAKGVHFLLAPGVNIYRAPTNGRNFEYLGEDPLLAARIARAYIEGVQSQGVAATVKHFAGNNSDYDRHRADAVVDERTLREIYLPAFEAAVKDAHVGAVMTAYNLVNGVQMSQNARLNVDVLRKQWGFPGVVMTDWTSTYDAIGVANGGVDLEMPSGRFLNRETLLPAIRDGRVSAATLDEKVRHILRLAVRFGWLDRDQRDLDVPRWNEAGREVALQSARESAVLLKNASLLPLDRARLRTVAVIGPDADPAVPAGGGSARVEPFYSISLLHGLADALPGKVVYHRGLPTYGELLERTDLRAAESDGEPGVVLETFENAELTGPPATRRIIRRDEWRDGLHCPPCPGARFTTFITPAAEGEYDLVLQGTSETNGYRLLLDGTVLVDAWDRAPALVHTRRIRLTATPHRLVVEKRQRRHQQAFRCRLGVVPAGTLVAPEAKALAAHADVVVIAAGFDADSEAEASDRTFALPFGQDELIREIAAANKNAIVVLTSGGGVDMTPWLDRVPAVLETWYAGQEGGRAAAEILLGDTNPSGHLPATFERRTEDNPTHASYYPADPASRRVPYTEGVFVGYRGYERNHVAPLFAFGHGLSYTSFKYANLAVTPGRSVDGRVSVAFDVTNSGARAGAAVAQVYVAPAASKVPRPPQELKGFAKVALDPGRTRRVTVDLDTRAFSYYDVSAAQWRADAGTFEIRVGEASDAIALRGSVTLTRTVRTPR